MLKNWNTSALMCLPTHSMTWKFRLTITITRSMFILTRLNSTHNYISYNKKSLLEPREKWYVNDSNSHIPNEVISLLQLRGESFCFPPNDIPKLTIEYIKHVENNFAKFHQDNCNNTCRSQICLFINQAKNIDRYRTKIDRKIFSALSTTKKFIINNPDTIFTRAGKETSVVALNRIGYIVKMETQFSDTNIYITIKRIPVNKLLRDLKAMLKRWLTSKYISTHTYSLLNSSNAILSRITQDP